MVSREPRPKSAYDFLGLLYCFMVLLCVCVVSWLYVILALCDPGPVVRYSLFAESAAKHQANKQTVEDSEEWEI